MSIVSVTPKWSRDRGQEARDANTRQRTYQVLTDADDSVDAILRASGLPRFNDAWPADGSFGVVSRMPRRRGPLLWEVDVTWRRQAWGGSGDPGTDPLSLAVEYHWRTQGEEVEVDVDIKGKSIRNAAGVRFEDALRETEYDIVLEATKNVASVSVATRWTAAGRLNADEYFGAPARHARIIDWHGEPQKSGAITYVREVFAIAFRFDGWDRRVLNQGTEKLDDDGKLIKVLDKNGQPITSPVWLSEDGKKTIPKAGMPNWLTFQTRREVSFGQFGI